MRSEIRQPQLTPLRNSNHSPWQTLYHGLHSRHEKTSASITTLLHMEHVHAISPGRGIAFDSLSACLPSPALGQVVSNGAAITAATAAASASAAVAAAAAAATAVVELPVTTFPTLLLRRDGDALADDERVLPTAVVLLRRSRLREGERELVEARFAVRPCESDRADAALTATDADEARVNRGTPRGRGGVGASRPVTVRVGVGGVAPREDDGTAPPRDESDPARASLAMALSEAPPFPWPPSDRLRRWPFRVCVWVCGDSHGA